MKPKGIKSLLGCCILSLLTQCTSPTPATRIASHPHLFESLKNHEKSSVQRGEICRGMSKDAVFLAWGYPSTTRLGETAESPYEEWIYRGNQPVQVQQVGFGNAWGPGWGPGRWDPYWGPGWGPYGSLAYANETIWLPYEAARVRFKRGKVETWARSLPR